MNDIDEEIKVLVVEDEIIIAETIKSYLQMSGYLVSHIATTAKEALEYCANNGVNCVIIDITLKGSQDGIWLADKIQNNFNLPYLFLTSHSDAKTVSRVINTNAYGFLTKPIECNQLITAIEIMLGKHKKIRSYQSELYKDNNVIFLKNIDKFDKIDILDICFIESQKNYLLIHTSTTLYKHRSTIKEFLEVLPSELFIKIHRAYIVNIKAIDFVDRTLNTLVVKNHKIPISRTYRKDLADKMGI